MSAYEPPQAGGYQQPPSSGYYGQNNGYQQPGYQQPPPPQQYSNYGTSVTDPNTNAPQTDDGSQQEGFAPQPGYVPQPHPAVTLYYGYNNYEPGLIYPDSSGAAGQEEAVEKPKCQDLCCAIFFLLSMGIFIGLGGWAFSLNISTVAPEYNWQLDRQALTFLGIAMATAIVISAGMLCFIQANAECMIWTAMIANAVAWFAIGAMCCALGQLWGIAFFFIGAILLLYPFCVRHRIKFVSVMIKYSVGALSKYNGVLPLALFTGAVVIGINWYGAVAMTRFATWYSTGAGYTTDEENTGTILIICMFFLLYWACEFLRGWLHTIVAGVVGTYWYLPNQSFATGPSLKRASTTSMGSIAFGTLLVSICHVCRVIARMKFQQLMKGNNGKNSAALIILLIVIACVACIFSCFEKALKWINHYAFTHVALYGTSYIESGKRVVETFFQSGFMMIVQKDMTGFVIGIGVLFSTAASAGVTFLVGWYLGLFDWDDYSKKAERIAFMITIAVFLCAYISNTILTPLQSAVTSTFVTWSEDGAALEQNHAAAFHEMVDARNKVWM